MTVKNAGKFESTSERTLIEPKMRTKESVSKVERQSSNESVRPRPRRRRRNRSPLFWTEYKEGPITTTTTITRTKNTHHASRITPVFPRALSRPVARENNRDLPRL